MTHCVRHPDEASKMHCRVCKKGCCEDCAGPLDICKKCWYKGFVVLFVIMIIGTYSSWILLLE